MTVKQGELEKIKNVNTRGRITSHYMVHLSDGPYIFTPTEIRSGKSRAAKNKEDLIPLKVPWHKKLFKRSSQGQRMSHPRR